MHQHHRAQGTTTPAATPAAPGPVLPQPTAVPTGPEHGLSAPPTTPEGLRPVWHQVRDGAPRPVDPGPHRDGDPGSDRDLSAPAPRPVSDGHRASRPVSVPPASDAHGASRPVSAPPASDGHGASRPVSAPPASRPLRSRPGPAPAPASAPSAGRAGAGDQGPEDVRLAARASLAAGRSPSLWWVCTGLVVSVVVGWTLGAAEGGLALAVLLAVSAAARAVLPRGPVALTVRSRTLDTAVLLALALGVGTLSQVIPVP